MEGIKPLLKIVKESVWGFVLLPFGIVLCDVMLDHIALPTTTEHMLHQYTGVYIFLITIGVPLGIILRLMVKTISYIIKQLRTED